MRLVRLIVFTIVYGALVGILTSKMGLKVNDPNTAFRVFLAMSFLNLIGITVYSLIDLKFFKE